MCLWILTACLGMLPANPTPVVVVPGVPPPILIPTTAATTTTTTNRPPMPGNMTAPPTMAPPTGAPTMGPPTGGPTLPNMTGMLPPMTMAPTMAPTIPPMTVPTMPSTAAPTQPPMPTIPATIGGGNLLSLIICTDPEVVCTINPYASPTGPLPIDPRLGTTPVPSGAVNMPRIMGYSAQVPSYDSTVNFPRQRRSLNALRIADYIQNNTFRDNKHKIVKRQSCTCVPTGTCMTSTTGAGFIDIRIVTPVGTQCPAGQEYCCGGTTPTTPIACGKLQTVPTTAVTPSAGQANFGEFPWQALVLTKQNDYIAGGVLVDSLNVITVTHRLVPYVVSGTAPNVKVRLGEWDAAGTYEPVPYQEYSVSKVFTHPQYVANTLQYDITVLRLASAVPFTPSVGAATTINRACLPPSASTTYTGQRCLVSGWGKDMFGTSGMYQKILKKVDVPIVAPATCQTQLQTARLGPSYVLDTTSFICAGGETNRDSCTGDGGSGLVCQVSGSWVVVGLVAWGLGCANANVPGVYVNVASFVPWIQQQIATA